MTYYTTEDKKRVIVTLDTEPRGEVIIKIADGQYSQRVARLKSNGVLQLIDLNPYEAKELGLKVDDQCRLKVTNCYGDDI